jgi:hypothetical protein
MEVRAATTLDDAADAIEQHMAAPGPEGLVSALERVEAMGVLSPWGFERGTPGKAVTWRCFGCNHHYNRDGACDFKECVSVVACRALSAYRSLPSTSVSEAQHPEKCEGCERPLCFSDCIGDGECEAADGHRDVDGVPLCGTCYEALPLACSECEGRGDDCKACGGNGLASTPPGEPRVDDEAVVEEVARDLARHYALVGWDQLDGDSHDIWRVEAREILAVARRHLAARPGDVVPSCPTCARKTALSVGATMRDPGTGEWRTWNGTRWRYDACPDCTEAPTKERP